MDKRALHHWRGRLRPFKVWYFLVAALLLGGMGVWALRANYTTMADLRYAVYEVDKANGDVEAALQALRAHVNAHMNTNLSREGGTVYPPIQLQYTYARLQEAEKKRVEEVNSRVYTEAQRHCERLYPASFSGGPRVPCIEQYVKDHGTQAQPIPADLYRFSFATPRWSPDLAGWSLVLGAVCLVLAVVRLLLGWVLRVTTK